MITDDILIAAAIVSALVVFATAGRATLSAFRKLTHVIDDLLGEDERPGVPSRPGLSERLARIEHELHPNSGLSIRDSVDRIELKLGVIEADMLKARQERDAILSGILKDRDHIASELGHDFGPAPYEQSLKETLK
jgi:hypothetical protein